MLALPELRETIADDVLFPTLDAFDASFVAKLETDVCSTNKTKIPLSVSDLFDRLDFEQILFPVVKREPETMVKAEPLEQQEPETVVKAEPFEQESKTAAKAEPFVELPERKTPLVQSDNASHNVCRHARTKNEKETHKLSPHRSAARKLKQRVRRTIAVPDRADFSFLAFQARVETAVVPST